MTPEEKLISEATAEVNDGLLKEAIRLVKQAEEGVAWLTAELDRVRQRAEKAEDNFSEMLSVLKDILAEYPEMDNDEEVNGGDMVEFICLMWPRIQAAVKKAEEKPL